MKKNVKKLGALLLAGAMAVSTVGCMPTSKPQESTGEQNAQASDATQGTEEPAAPEGLEVDTQTPITLRLNRAQGKQQQNWRWIPRRPSP